MSRYFEDCVDCENRKPGCHSYCKSYQQDKEKQLEEKGKIDKYKRMDGEFSEYQKNKNDKRKRRQ